MLATFLRHFSPLPSNRGGSWKTLAIPEVWFLSFCKTSAWVKDWKDQERLQNNIFNWSDAGKAGFRLQHFGASVLAPDFRCALLSSVTLALHAFIWIPSSTPLMLSVPSCHPCLSPYLCFAGGLTHLSITHPACDWVIAGFLLLHGASCPGLT